MVRCIIINTDSTGYPSYEGWNKQNLPSHVLLAALSSHKCYCWCRNFLVSRHITPLTRHCHTTKSGRHNYANNNLHVTQVSQPCFKNCYFKILLFLIILKYGKFCHQYVLNCLQGIFCTGFSVGVGGGCR